MEMRKRSREPILLLTRWEQKNRRQPVPAVVEQRPASGRPRGNRPRGSADTTRHMQVPCQTRIWDEFGIYRTNWADLPQWVERITPVGGAIRTGGWSDSHHYLRGDEAIRPAPPRPSEQPSATRSVSSAPLQKHHRAKRLAMPCPAWVERWSPRASL
jgi:hypothetical protein